MTAQVFLQRALAEHRAGHFAAAAEAYRALLAEEPGNPVAHMHLGVVQRLLGDLAASEASYRTAIILNPQYAEAYANLGACLQAQGALEEAIAHCRQALRYKPELFGAQFTLGLALQEQGRRDESRQAFEQVLKQAPDFVEARVNLGAVLLAQGRFDEAEAILRQAQARNPAIAAIHSNLSAALKAQNRLSEAEAAARQALALSPQDADAHNNLGSILTAQGRYAEAQACFRRVLELRPEHRDAHSNYLYALNFCEDPATLVCEARRYGKNLSARVKAAGGPYRNWFCPATASPLRVGLVSGDLRGHPVGYFLEGVLAATAPEAIRWFAYPNHAAGDDEISARLRAHCAAWRPLQGLDAAGAARLIHEDGLHILIDLSGHTGGNCLPLFAWKPAPIQITWLGYFATTGVAEIDCILVDKTGAPYEFRDQFTERLVHLPDTRLCFTPPADAPDISLPPVLGRGWVTYGNMQNPAKINEDVLAAWAEILRRQPTAQLRLQHGAYGDGQVQARLRAALQAQGIDAQRITFHPGLPREDYLAAYAEIDILLDTFPYPGGTTTCEALWMGVPTVTLRGNSLLARQGASLLTAAGLPDWIADGASTYAAIALTKAQDCEDLANLRAGLRERLRCSPLCDARGFTWNLTRTLRRLWTSSPAAKLLAEQAAQVEQCLLQGVQAYQSGRTGEALTVMRRALEIAPRHAQVLNNLAAFAAMSGEAELAVDAYRQLLVLQPDHVDAGNNLGYFLQRLGQLAEAEAAYRANLERHPEHADTLNNYGLLLKQQNRLAEAEAAFRRAHAADSDSAIICSNLGDLLREQGDSGSAETLLQRACERDPGYAEAWNNLGILYRQQGRFGEAETAYRRAIAIAPDKPLAWNNLGNLLKELGQSSEAETAYRQALRIAPQMAEATMNLGLLLLRQGRWEAGWKAHEARHSPAFRPRKVLPPPLPTTGPCPILWDGSSLQGKTLLVWPEQGFGDTLQFVRFLPQLKALGVTRLTLACTRPLFPLLRTQGLADEVICTDAWQPSLAAQYDAWTFLMSLPLHLGVTLDALSACLPYLQADFTRVAYWQQRQPVSGLCVGLAWRGNPLHKNDAHRSLPSLDILAPLWSLPGVSFVSLQRDWNAADTDFARAHPLLDWGSQFHDFAESAAAISCLDLVISVDTAIAHLAGALGKPCVVLLSAHDTDWRWLELREDSPWYPGVMRLFRQAERGDWRGVIDRLMRTLATQTCVDSTKLLKSSRFFSC